MSDYTIPAELLENYSMQSLDGYKNDFGNSVDTEIGFYQTFLLQTDYICNKLVEGEATREDYEDELTARAFCRTKIRELSA